MGPGSGKRKRFGYGEQEEDLFIENRKRFGDWRQEMVWLLATGRVWLLDTEIGFVIGNRKRFGFWQHQKD